MESLDKFFKIKERGSTIPKEIIGGIVTFFAMAYILAVNPGMLGAAGMPIGGVFTATALASAIATIAMAFMANVPIALSAGMGLNAFFTYTVVIGMGASWQTALFAVLIEGIIFIFLSVFNVRQYIVESIPANIRKAIPVGIGLFILLIGLANAGVVAGDTGTIIGFADVKTGSALLAMLGLVITVVLFLKNVPGAIFIGIILTTIIGIPLGVTKIPENFSVFSLPAAPLTGEFFAGISWGSIFSFKFLIILFTFLFVDIFDTLGTVLGVTKAAGLQNTDGSIPKVKQIFLADAIGTTAGALLGTSTVTSYVESGSGVASGARTGLSALITGVLFLIALFFSPVFLLIPGAATAPALILVGAIMFKGIKDVDFENFEDCIPSAVTILFMGFAYSIAAGIMYGILAWVICKIAKGQFKEISVPTWILFAVFAVKLILG
jgi:AGZA family xanthine/uracil permease-like MFS transporter